MRKIQSPQHRTQGGGCPSNLSQSLTNTVLDNRLDVAQHMTLCRHYVREMRRSVLIGTPDPEHASKRSSQILESMGDLNYAAPGPSMYATDKDRDQDAQMSAYLREDRASPTAAGFHDSPHSSGERARPSPGTGSTPRDLMTDSNSPFHEVARQDIRASAEKILYTFLLPGAEREIVLPSQITEEVTRSIEEEGRDDPEVFDLAKDYVFQAMERDAFPGFLRMKALGNLIPPTLIMRLIIGLVSMFGGFWAAFVLIFLDSSRLTRLWVRRSPSRSEPHITANTRASAHSALHAWRLLPRVISVLPRPRTGSDWPERVHAFQLLAGAGAIRPQTARKARPDGFGRDGNSGCGTTGAVRPRARQTALRNRPIKLPLELLRDRETPVFFSSAFNLTTS